MTRPAALQQIPDPSTTGPRSNPGKPPEGLNERKTAAKAIQFMEQTQILG